MIRALTTFWLCFFMGYSKEETKQYFERRESIRKVRMMRNKYANFW